MFDISVELSTTQDGLVFLLVRFLLESSLPIVNEWINPNIGSKYVIINYEFDFAENFYR